MEDWSKSRTINALRCGLRAAWQEGQPKTENARMTRGRLLAKIDEAAKRGQAFVETHPQYADLLEQTLADYSAFRAKLPLLPLALYSNVEEDRVSPALRHESEYDGEKRSNFAVDLPSGENRVTGARDSVCTSADYTTKIVHDTKSSDYMEEWAKRIEAVFYAIPTILEAPGYPAYQVREQFVTTGGEHVEEFTEAELPALLVEARDYIEQAKAALKASLPRLNQFCGDCLVPDCQLRSLTRLSAPDPLVNLGRLSMTELDAADDQLAIIEKLAKATRGRIDAEELARVRADTIVESGRQWSLGRRQSREILVSAAATLAAAALEAGTIDEDDFASMFSVGIGAVEKLADKAPEMSDAILALARKIDGKEMVKRGKAPKGAIESRPVIEIESAPPPPEAAPGSPQATTAEGSALGVTAPGETSSAAQGVPETAHPSIRDAQGELAGASHTATEAAIPPVPVPAKLLEIRAALAKPRGKPCVGSYVIQDFIEGDVVYVPGCGDAGVVISVMKDLAMLLICFGETLVGRLFEPDELFLFEPVDKEPAPHAVSQQGAAEAGSAAAPDARVCGCGDSLSTGHPLRSCVDCGQLNCWICMHDPDWREPVCEGCWAKRLDSISAKPKGAPIAPYDPAAQGSSDAADQDGSKCPVAFVVDGAKVWYHSRPNTPHEAIVDGTPWLLGGHTWVVRLKGLTEEYAKSTCRGAKHVPCAAVFALRPRGDTPTTNPPALPAAGLPTGDTESLLEPVPAGRGGDGTGITFSEKKPRFRKGDRAKWVTTLPGVEGVSLVEGKVISVSDDGDVVFLPDGCEASNTVNEMDLTLCRKRRSDAGHKRGAAVVTPADDESASNTKEAHGIYAANEAAMKAGGRA